MTHQTDMFAVQRLQWLLDAPLFVDDALVDTLFDAVVRPEFEVQSREVGHVSEDARRRLFGAEAGAGYKLGLSFLTGKLNVSGKVSGHRERTSVDTSSHKLVETPVVTTGRRLEEIAAVYISEHPERIAFLSSDGTARTFGGAGISAEQLEQSAEDPPRMLVFLDIVAQTPIMPMACELVSGSTRLLYEDYIERAFREGTRPTYPADGESDRETKTAYWRALTEAYSSRDAMEIVEGAGKSNQGTTFERISWIDFRLPIGSNHWAHLHCVSDGKFHTGVFGYNFVNRGFKQGVRIVGTLKAGLDVNVLAIFDK